MSTNENRPPIGSRRGGRRNKSNGYPQHTTASLGGFKVYSEDGQRVIGLIRGDVFSKYVHSLKGHMLKKPRGWALDVYALETVNAYGVTTIVLLDQDTDTSYQAFVSDFEARGVRLDRGYGVQVCLPLGYWSIDGQPPSIGGPGTVDGPDAVPVPRQMTLW